MNLKGVLNDDAIQALRARNAERAAAAIQALGDRYCARIAWGIAFRGLPF